MSLSQALSVALAGVHVTQQGLSVIAGNVANANTPGYVDETITPVEVAAGGSGGSGVDSSGINRNLNALLQSQLWTESSGGSYADTAAQIYQQLQQIYGTPGSSSSFDAVYNNFTSSLQALATGPSSYSSQAAVIGSAQALAQNLNGMTAGIQQLRSQAEAGISSDVQTANTALAQIANINLQLESAAPDAATATLEDQRDQDVAQLSQLMNVRVQKNAATALWSANPSQDGAGTITLTSPSGSQSDLIASGAIQSGEIGAYLQMRDTILPQAQNQLDELANQMSQALSNQTTAGTPVVSGSQTGFGVDVGSLSAGNSVQLSYTDTGNVQHTITLVALGPGGSLPLQTSPSNPNNQIVGVNFAGGMAAVVTQLNAAFGTNLQFSNPSGAVLQAVNASSTTNVVNALSATSTVTSLTSGSAQLPLFLDGTTPITGALTAAGSQTTGLAGRITVNAALASAPASLVAYTASTAAGDPTRPNFLLSQLTGATLTYAPTTGIGSAQQPFSGTLADYMSAIVSQQSQAANAATNLQQGQDTVVSALQQRFNSTSGVSIDTELSNLIALQNAYGANARVMSTIQQMMSTLLQTVQ
jgi:flagellar hook-associated protein 1 FlgK